MSLPSRRRGTCASARFLFMRRAPTSSPLFPYTTLFRSRQRRLDRPGGGRLGGDRRGDGRDRKSTRLNSSHSQTSYAVFCLKKKRYESAFTAARHMRQPSGTARTSGGGR